MHIAMVGTRGVPASYGGFETAVEEIGRRLVADGHQVTVYCRSSAGDRPRTHLGMDLVHLPALRVKVAETLSHTALSVLRILFSRRRPDMAFVFNAANSPFLPLLRLSGVPVALHMDGLEWKRGKWGRLGRAYYRHAEAWGVRLAQALIADAQGISDYYRERFDVDTELLTYGAPILETSTGTRLGELGLQRDRFHLVVARFEPENHVAEIVEGYRGSDASYPLVVVGSAPYAAEYTRRVTDAAEGDDRIRLLGGVYDQELLDELYAGALTYLHGHSVGGTNPSLLRAMGAGTAVIGYDVVFNRETAGLHGRYFASPVDIAAAVEAAEADPSRTREDGDRLRLRAATAYDWDAVATGYARLAARLVARDARPSSAALAATPRGDGR